MKFWKAEGLGNDFICVDCLKTPWKLSKKETIQLCDRRFGIGADGVLIVKKSKKADFYLQIINADGSQPENCGNGIRCIAMLVKHLGLIKKNDFSIEVPAGVRRIKIVKNTVSVDMLEPNFSIKSIFKYNQDSIIDESVDFPGFQGNVSILSLGNPHCVIKLKSISDLDLAKIGPLIEKDKRFYNGTNVEFIKIVNKNLIEQRTWERGCGETHACGTGATASAVVAIKLGWVNNPVKVKLVGGELLIDWAGENAIMNGPAKIVYSGLI